MATSPDTRQRVDPHKGGGVLNQRKYDTEKKVSLFCLTGTQQETLYCGTPSENCQRWHEPFLPSLGCEVLVLEGGQRRSPSNHLI